ncbi:MAG: type I 3-dehydroquinate dehydratase [Planctomycetota bacterium]|nr:type I 3-dehydroquinate dehydratase [Planctomycetota bacterium]
MSTLLCVPIMVRDMDEALVDAAEAKRLGADLVELRIDEVFSGGTQADMELEIRRILRLVAACPLPTIVTCRSAREGGAYDGDESARVSLYERLGTASGTGEHPPRYLDFELESYVASENIRQKINLAVDHPHQTRDLSTSLILSNHDFQQRPADLHRRVLRMREQPAARVHKFAFRCRSLRDNLELFEMLSQRDTPLIALGMGEFGLMSRVLAPKFGGFLTFAALRPAGATAPGQPTVTELLELYRFRAITPRTKVYGIVGWPVSHSMSPLVHNAQFSRAVYDGVYLPLPIAVAEGASAEDAFLQFKVTLGSLIDDQRLDFAGCSVTLPHKENLVRLARERSWTIDPLADAIGAANTLVIDREGGTVKIARVLNTDIEAAVAPLREALCSDSGDPLAGKALGVLGAGGVARAVAAGLAREGARVTIFNRTPSKAQALADELSRSLSERGLLPRGGTIVGAALADACSAVSFAAFINCTPIGMKGGPAPAESPLDVARLQHAIAASAGLPGGTSDHTPPLVMDTVYAPIQTPLLLAAKAAGWRTIDGVGMFARQAAAQSAAWLGNAGRHPATVGDIERMVREKLAGQPA